MVLTSIQRSGARCTDSQLCAIEKKGDHLRIQCRRALHQRDKTASIQTFALTSRQRTARSRT